MNELIGRVVGFEKQVFPNRSDLYAKLASQGQSPKALIISCADSRVVPEHIMQAQPGDLFVCRNIGNIVPKDPVTLGLCSQRELDALVAKAAKAAGMEAPTDTRLEGDREALIEQLRQEREQAARDAEALARGETVELKPAFFDPFKR